jgi:hypothetical protein
MDERIRITSGSVRIADHRNMTTNWRVCKSHRDAAQIDFQAGNVYLFKLARMPPG